MGNLSQGKIKALDNFEFVSNGNCVRRFFSQKNRERFSWVFYRKWAAPYPLLTREKQEIVNADLTSVRIEEKFRLLVGQTVNVKLPDYNHTEEVIYAFRTNSLEPGSLRTDSHWPIIDQSETNMLMSQWESFQENISIRARNWTKHVIFLIILKVELWL